MNEIIELDFPLALWFYETFIFKPYEQKRHLLREFGFNGGSPASSQDWELFVAILLNSGRNSASKYGHDLMIAEVKSARVGNSFEYQYHLNTGIAKLDAEHTINHVFVSYDEESVVVRSVSGDELRDTFAKWRGPLLKNYDSENPKQRFRRSVAYGAVKKKGEKLLEIQNGQLAFPRQIALHEQEEAQRRGAALLRPPEQPPAN